MVDTGLNDAIEDIVPVEFELPNKDKVRLCIEEGSISCPLVPQGSVGMKNHNVFPTECRQRAGTYKGRFTVKVSWSVNGGPQNFFIKDMGEIPIMVKVCIQINLIEFSSF